MRAQTKLGWILFGYGIVAFGIGYVALRFALVLPPGRYAVMQGLAVATVACIVIGAFAYLIAATFTRRLASLAEQANDVRQHPALHAVEVGGGGDEVAAIARVVNDLRARLTDGEEARNQLVADVAHELRTPVAIIRGHLETMLKGAEELRPENLLPLLDEAKRVSRLIQDMRDLNLAESGRLRLDREWIAFAPTLDEIVSILALEAEDKDVTIRTEGEWGGELYCDPARLKQVLVNLIGNAIRYVPEGGNVLVAYEASPGELRFRVTDNGPGIAPEHLPYLFKRFYRVEASRNRMSGGTGLGLAIAKEFVEAHGGSIRAESALGEGTSFHVVLPLFPLHP
ncbi:sensor histidine kinase [Paenibacillus sp.]|uniref:sensor histidine kinase n=1 Tax=Paenibacillus sp. TaxID=58172 RepID=UPI002D6BEFBF|nr:ATP-binding protein [Paenibacillus sp.]HZG56151.1 ATP-binding protein [Paenibacillus sp.]